MERNVLTPETLILSFSKEKILTIFGEEIQNILVSRQISLGKQIYLEQEIETSLTKSAIYLRDIFSVEEMFTKFIKQRIKFFETKINIYSEFERLPSNFTKYLTTYPKIVQRIQHFLPLKTLFLLESPPITLIENFGRFENFLLFISLSSLLILGAIYARRNVIMPSDNIYIIISSALIIAFITTFVKINPIVEFIIITIPILLLIKKVDYSLITIPYALIILVTKAVFTGTLVLSQIILLPLSLFILALSLSLASKILHSEAKYTFLVVSIIIVYIVFVFSTITYGLSFESQKLTFTPFSLNFLK